MQEGRKSGAGAAIPFLEDQCEVLVVGSRAQSAVVATARPAQSMELDSVGGLVDD